MKKFVLFTLLCLSTLMLLTGCGKSNKLYIMNWDEYMDEDLIAAFEEEYNCEVVVEIAQSNETMYTKIAGDAAPYDLAFPSDYMISQLKNDNLVKTIDFAKLSNYSYSAFDSTLTSLINRDCSDIKNYFVPYFWGSLGIMYNTNNLSEAQVAAIEENGWNVLFDKTILGNNVSVGMYASARDSIAAALLFKGYSLNTKDRAQLAEAETALASMNYTKWATDELKANVAAGTLDVALVYSGDFFDMVYSAYETDENAELTFDCYTPADANNIFFDAMVIPTTSQNTDLAYDFINFMLDYDNALQNAQYVGYCPTLKAVYDAMVADPELDGITNLDAYWPGDITNGEIYQYLGADIYDYYDEIYRRVKK